MIKKYTIKNKNNYALTVLNLGAIIHAVEMPDREGRFENIIHGFDKIEDYEKNEAFFGAIIGRVAGRIKAGRFEIEGKPYKVATRDRGNALHGGLRGFDTKLWEVEERDQQLILRCTSEDMEEGFPGKINVQVTYSLSDDNVLTIDYWATTDKTTYLNMTNHSYFNLNPKGDILSHELHVASDYVLELDETSIPTGALMPVEGTPFDFTRPKKVGQDIQDNHPQIKLGNGYDHPWLLRNEDAVKARLYNEESGREMTMLSDQNVLVLYSYNFPVSKDQQHAGLAVEFQNDPDSMHQEHFNQCLLKPDEIYRQKTEYHFTVR